MTQPLTCPFCNADKLASISERHVFKCGTVLILAEHRKPKAERSQECVECAKGLRAIA